MKYQLPLLQFLLNDNDTLISIVTIRKLNDFIENEILKIFQMLRVHVKVFNKHHISHMCMYHMHSSTFNDAIYLYYYIQIALSKLCELPICILQFDSI